MISWDTASWGKYLSCISYMCNRLYSITVWIGNCGVLSTPLDQPRLFAIVSKLLLCGYKIGSIDYCELVSTPLINSNLFAIVSELLLCRYKTDSINNCGMVSTPLVKSNLFGIVSEDTTLCGYKNMIKK